MRHDYLSTAVLLFAVLFSGCTLEKREVPGAIVSVGNRYLTREMLDQVIPDGLSPRDSSAFADAYVRHWAEDELVYDVAQKNIPDVERIENLVDRYRRELFVHEYQKQILSEKLDAEISDDAVKNYYRTHLDKFVLKTPIVKGLFLKVAETTPELKNLKKWYRGKDHASVENIEKYTLHNIINYDYFYDRWVSFDEVMSAIPYTVTDANRFLQTHTFLEINNEGYWYLLNISDYLPAGAHMPLDFARTQIEEILLNQKRMDFLHQMNKELYQEALENRKIKYYGRVY